MLLRDHAKARNDKAKSDLVAEEQKLREAQTNLANFKEEFSDKLIEATNYKRKLKQATFELDQNNQLQAVLESWLSPSGSDFIDEYSDLIKSQNLDQKIHCPKNPSINEENESESLNYKNWCTLLSNELEKWKILQVTPSQALSLSPVLQCFVALQNKDVPELNTILKKIDDRKAKYKSILLELKNSSDIESVVALKLIEIENQERQINNQVDSLKNLLKITLEGLAAAEDNVINSKREYDTFEVRIETYDE